MSVGVGPGRIDMLGGVADYSGSLVLQVATAVRTTAVASLAPCADEAGEVAELESEGFGAPVRVPLRGLRAALEAASGDAGALQLAGVRAFLEGEAAPQFARYMFGSLASFTRETGWLPPRAHALRISVSSTVPASQGVSSSASIEVATLRALEALSGKSLGRLQLAHAAQRAENFVVGAPCGLMDQLASALGAPGEVLPILCRPDDVRALVPLPPSVTVVGWPSGVKHSVAASPYLVARTATFMGRRVAERALGRKLAHAAELTPSELAVVLPTVPEAISGADFLKEFGGVDDALSQIVPDTVYATRNSLRFPVEESFRCSLALSLLRALQAQEKVGAGAAGAPDSGAAGDFHVAALTQIGELMRQSHRGYDSIGLGCHETDVMLERLAAIGPARGIYGARMSGGGSGGTVAVLLERSALPLLEALARELTFGTPFTGLIC